MKKSILGAVLLLLFFATTIFAEIPGRISYQGMLSDGEGLPLNGLFSISMKLYEQQFFGEPIWEEVQQVSVENGVFDVLLGNNTSINNLKFNNAYWLEFQVAENPALPRVLITSAAYSLASKLSLDNRWTLAESGDISANNPGNVYIGETEAQSKLNVGGDLSVSGDIWVANYLHARFIDAYEGSISATDIIVNGNITTTGRIGIGNDDPQELLDVNGGIKIGNSENSVNGTIRWNGSDFEGFSGDRGWQSLTTDKLWSHIGENIFPALSGNVGIGTNDPAEKLQVNGNAIINGNLNLYGELGTSNILVDGNIVAMNSLGVKTSSPNSTFQVDGSKAWKVNEVNGNTTLDDTYNVVLVNTTSVCTISLPEASTCPGRVYTIKRIGFANVIVDPAGSETIDGAATYSLYQNYAKATITSNGVAWFIIGS